MVKLVIIIEQQDKKKFKLITFQISQHTRPRYSDKKGGSNLLKMYL